MYLVQKEASHSLAKSLPGSQSDAVLKCHGHGRESWSWIVMGKLKN